MADVPAPRPSDVSSLSKPRDEHAVNDLKKRQENGPDHHRNQVNPAVTLCDDVMAVSDGMPTSPFWLLRGYPDSVPGYCGGDDENSSAGKLCSPTKIEIFPH